MSGEGFRSDALAARAAAWSPEVARSRAAEDWQRATDPTQPKFERESTAADMVVCAGANKAYCAAVAERLGALQAVAQQPTVVRDSGDGLRMVQQSPSLVRER